LGELVWKGWRPRRSIVLCSWDAEEYGLVGSTEWVEQNIDLLGLNAVAYLNLDTGVGGSGFSAGASPQLDGLLQEVTKQVSFVIPLGDVLLLTILVRLQILGLLAFT
jgi:N-acetylated-alpha-linked acidic dipeptidase